MIRAPYNFVPLNNDVYIPKWYDKISQDIPFKYGESGTITVKFQNLTPLFVRDGHTLNEDDPYSAHVLMPDGTKRYFIPGTSIKGMIRSVMEILTFSRMDRFDDDFFGYRNFNTKIPTGKKYTNAMTNVLCGWLQKRDDDYIIKPCGDPDPILITEVKDILKDKYNEQLNAIEKHKLFGDKFNEKYPIIKGKRLVCTGYMHGKRHEYLFNSTSTLPPLYLQEEVKEAFISVYKPSPYYNDIIDSLKRGEEIPVFYKEGRDGVENLGLTRMYRYPYKKRVSDGINQTLKDIEGNRLESGLDMVQCIFGFTAKKNSLKGRIQFGNAFTESNIPDQDLIERKGVLGSPLASYYPLYISQNGNTYTTYDDEKIEIAGRKRYRIHENSYLTNIPEGNGNEKVMTSLKLLPKECCFEMKIHVHNLLPIELGALISALTFHNTSNIYHNIGMAKSYGYGKIYINKDSVLLNGFKHEVTDYLKSFEENMSIFTTACKKGKWTDSEQLNKLFSISSDHNADLEFMSLEDYKNGKKNTDFSKLNETAIPINRLVNAEYIKRQSLKSKFVEAESLVVNKKFYEAINIYIDLQKEMTGYDISDIEQRISQIKEFQIIAINESKANAMKQKKIEVEIQLQKGLGAFLDALNLNRIYKVRDFKMCDAKVTKWLKDADRRTLNPDEINDLAITLSRIFQSITKEKDKKDWMNPDSNIWKKVALWVGTEQKIELYKKVIV